MDILVAISSIIGVAFPITVYFLSKRNKANKAKRLIELLEFRIKLQNLLKREKDINDIPFLNEELINLIEEIDISLNKQSEKTNRLNIWYFLIFVSIEILVSINKLSDLVTESPAPKYFGFLEGIFESPESRIILFLVVFLISFILSFRLISWIRSKITTKNNVKLNFYLILTFNLIVLILWILIGGIDYLVNWF